MDRLLVVGKMMDIVLEIRNLSETVMRETLINISMFLMMEVRFQKNKVNC